MYGKNNLMAGAALDARMRPLNPDDFERPEYGYAQQAMSQVEAQQSQLSRTSERLHHCIAELDGLVSKLESVLDPVLNPPAPATAAGNTSAPQPVRCPLGASMDARADEVCEISARVRALLERLAC